jgi:hypothetical protein
MVVCMASLALGDAREWRLVQFDGRVLSMISSMSLTMLCAAGHVQLANGSDVHIVCALVSDSPCQQACSSICVDALATCPPFPYLQPCACCCCNTAALPHSCMLPFVRS